ncbi:MAG TPA: hypothetical protein VGL71_10555, partial [Urbifossiella sp.]
MRLLLAGIMAFISSPWLAAATPMVAPAPRVLERAIVESSLPTSGRHIRQFAFDADSSTYFASEGNAGKTDHLTLRFDRPAAIQSI